MNQGYNNLNLLRDIWHFLKPYKKRFFVGISLRITSDIVWLFPPYAISKIITFATTYQNGDSLTYFWNLMIAVWIVAVYHIITHDLAKFLIYPIGERMALDSYEETIAHMFKLDSSWHEKENSGNKLKRMSKGSDSLKEMMRLFIDLVIESSINIIGITILVSTLGSMANIVIVFFFATYFAISFILNKKVGIHYKRSSIKEEEFEGLNFEAINNINTVKSLNIGKNILKLVKESAQRLMTEIKLRVFWFRTRSASLNIYREIFRQILIFYTVWQVLQGNLEVGTIALALLYFEKVSASAEELAEFSNKFMLSKISMMRLKDILNEKPNAEVNGTKDFNPKWKKLTVKNLNFTYGGKQTLNDLSFSIKRGEKIGIVGISGTGKSTLLKLLLKLYDNYEGSIQFDDLALHDIKRKSYLKYVSYVPQDTELFNLSLRDNVTLSELKNHSEQKFQKAIEIAHVNDFTHKLPQGVDSFIGEKGIKLSGGERQRVGIARAIYKNPEILFLDEATSHLDTESERKIQEALHQFFKNITAVVIAHRLSTLKEMDRILVISNGTLLEEGTFEELIKKEGKFHNLWKKQKF
ncbi:MAG: ABC transporter ATP-binding protein [Patescibacteria group bacterium]